MSGRGHFILCDLRLRVPSPYPDLRGMSRQTRTFDPGAPGAVFPAPPTHVPESRTRNETILVSRPRVHGIPSETQ